MNRDEVEHIVLGALSEMDADEPSMRPDGENSRQTVLYGPKGRFDSLGLVRYVVLVEERLREETGLPLVLTDDRAMSQSHSPFRTVATLVDYLDMLIKERHGA